MLHAFMVAVAALVTSFMVSTADAQSDTSRTVSAGGISVPGWTGQVDPQEARAGRTVADSKLTKEGDVLHVTTGPAVVYWNPANTAAGDYTVKATFTETKYMNLNNHPHPYGIMIAGNDLGTDKQSYLYCATYGNGTFILRGFGLHSWRMPATCRRRAPWRGTWAA